MQHSALCCLLQMHSFGGHRLLLGSAGWGGVHRGQEDGMGQRGPGRTDRQQTRQGEEARKLWSRIPLPYSQSEPQTLLGDTKKCLPDPGKEVQGWCCLSGLNAWQSLKASLAFPFLSFAFASLSPSGGPRAQRKKPQSLLRLILAGSSLGA